MSDQGTQTTGTTNTDSSSASAGAAGAAGTTVQTGVTKAATEALDNSKQQAADTSTAKDEKTGEAKTSQEQKPEEKKQDEAKAAPEKYEDFKIPEGVKIDANLLTEIHTLGKDLKLPQAEAQKLVDAGVKAAQHWNTQLANNIKATQTKWATDLKADAELGGDKLAENMAVANKALDAYDTNGKLKALLTETGLNNNVDVIRAFHKIGSTLKQDTVVQPNSGGSVMTAGPGSLQAAADRLYKK